MNPGKAMINKINIVTPVHNGEDSIENTYLSIAAQSYSNWKWIIIDDHSADKSFEICSRIAKNDSRILLLKNSKKKGAGSARNYGLEFVESGLVAFIDADDTWHWDFLEVMLPFVRNAPSMAFSGYERHGKGVTSDFIPQKVVRFENLFRGSDISCLTAVYHFRSVGEIPRFGEIRARNDLVFNLRALKVISHAQPVQKILATYNLNDGSISRNKFRLVYWQYIVSRNFGRSVFTSVIDVICWAVYGILKYR